ncbi:unnamed protein product, partial [Discosporangium mesarthrocarpum]
MTWKAGVVKKALGKGPRKRVRGAFKLPKSLVPLGVWPSGERWLFDLPYEWKASALKRIEQPPPYRKLKANLYPSPAMRGLVPVDEVPLCHCSTEVGCGRDCINRQLFMECAPGRCKSRHHGEEMCLNTAIQAQSFPTSRVFRTLEGRGWGLKLVEPGGAKQGTLLHEYMGEVITMEECRKRLQRLGEDGSGLDFYFASLDGNLVLDAGPMGSEARFANHSCNPNCHLEKWSVMGETRVVLVAGRDLACEEELTYNYRADTLGGMVQRQRCLCGEAECSGFIGAQVLTSPVDEWLERAGKVMGMSRPHLDTIRDLVAEGRKLGFQKDEKSIDNITKEEEEDQRSTSRRRSDGTRFCGREMECLVHLLEEANAWLLRLATLYGEKQENQHLYQEQVHEGRRIGKESQEAQKKPELMGGVGNTTSTPTMASPGQQPAPNPAQEHTPASDDIRVTDGEEEEEEMEVKVELRALEVLIESAPEGIQIDELGKAKKTLAKAKQAQTMVLSLLEAAKAHGVHPGETMLGVGAEAAGEGGGEVKVGIGEAGGWREVGAGKGHEEHEKEGTGHGEGMDVDVDEEESTRNAVIEGGRCGMGVGLLRSGARGGAEAGGGEVVSSTDSTVGGFDGEGEGLKTLQVLEVGDRAGNGLAVAAFSSCYGDVSSSVPAEAGAGAGTGGMAREAEARAKEASGAEGGERGGSEAGAGAAVAAAAGKSSEAQTGVGAAPGAAVTPGGQGREQQCPKTQDPQHPVDPQGCQAQTPRSAGPRTPHSTVPVPAPLPPKPMVWQVHQAIRMCRAVSPVVVPGWEQLEAIVVPAEAWAQRACRVLRLKVQAFRVRIRVRVRVRGRIRPPTLGEDEETTGKWGRLGLDFVALETLEEKLKEVAGFSMVRDSRESKIAKDNAREKRRQEAEKAKEHEQALTEQRRNQGRCRISKRRRASTASSLDPSGPNPNPNPDAMTGDQQHRHLQGQDELR